jgi:MFS family permease
MSHGHDGVGRARGRGRPTTAAAIVVPLALCQFLASYAGSNMNVAISSIAKDLHTDVIGVQTAITMFMLTMAALMIPGSKLTDILGRKFCFMLGLGIYGIGALLSALAPNLAVLTVGYSLFEGVGSALMIPPIYIIITVAFTETTERARFFGLVSAAAGIGAAAGPLIGGLITSSLTWRWSFGLQVALTAGIALSALRMTTFARSGSRPHFDLLGAVLSAVGLFLVVFGLLQSGTYGWFGARQDFVVGGVTVIHRGGVSPVWLFFAAGAIVLAACAWHLFLRERRGKDPLFSLSLLRNKVSDLGLVTQNVQWLTLQGSFFVVAVFLQEARGYSAIQTGLILTPATIGILGSSVTAARLARRYAQRTLIIAGFVTTLVGVVLLLLLVRKTSNIVTFVPGLLLMGAGTGTMLTSSVNVVQSAFPDALQGEISGVSRSVSNLGSAMGTAIAGSVLVSAVVEGNKNFALALIVVACAALIGLVTTVLLPRRVARSR